MKTTRIQVVNRQLIISNKIIYTGKSNVDNFKFSFDDEWLNLNKTLVIIVDSNTYHVPLLNDEAILPTEIYSKNSTVSIGVFGKFDDIILASELKKISIHEGAYKEGQPPDNLPTPTQWDLYVEEINRLLSEAKISEEECRKILLEVQTIQNDVEKAELNVEAYNENHGKKMTEYNNNATQKTSQFDANYTEKINSINDVESAVIDNINSKNTEFNTNATNKTSAFDENVVVKTNDFDTHIAEKMKEFEEFSEGITIITSGTDDLVEGESILPARSMHLVYETDEDEVNQDA